MMESRILGAGMVLLFSLRFLRNKASGIKAADHFNKFFIVSCSFLSSHGRVISTLQEIRMCDYFIEQFTPAIYYSLLPLNPTDKYGRRN